MEWTDLINKSEKELKELLAEKRQELLTLSFKAHTRELKRVDQLRRVRKTIARIMTALKQKQAA